MKKYLKSMIGFVFMISVIASGSMISKADVGFDSPEEVMDYFMGKIQEGNIAGALEAFSIEKASEEYDFAGQVERMASWFDTLEMPYPSNSETFVELNKYHLLSKRMSEICNFMFSFVADEVFLEGMTVPLANVDILGIMDVADIERLTELELVRMDYLWPEVQDSEHMRQNSTKRAEIYGGDDMYEYLILYRLGDEYFYNGITFIKYGKKYCLWQLHASMSGLNSACYVETITEDGYMEELVR